jgi:solute carrier family 25 carnitine/acylcarnitine transporter 20/29
VQIQKGEADRIYTGSIDAARKIYKQYGIRGLNRGQIPTTIRESTGLCLSLTTIEKVSKKLTPPGLHHNEVPVYVPMTAGAMGGTMYWMFNYPFDYVKTLMQSDKLGDFKYPTMRSVFKEQYRLGGWRIFFKGYLICMMRSLPVNSASVATYRVMQRFTGSVSH